MKILGIDESGRGPVCGPMVMCGYLIDEENVPQLKDIGVRDSKLLTAEKRKELSPLLKKISDDFVTLKIKADEIDSSSNLNKLEIEKMHHIINMLSPDVAIIDSPEVNTTAFSRKISSGVGKNIKIISENYADRKYHEVGAASIIAKVERDAEISKLHKQHGCFGSGYTHDEITIRFLKDWIKKNKEFPNFVRKSWSTTQRLLEEKEQSNMKRFAK